MRRYGVVTAVLYDVFSGERPLYRPGRVAAVESLRLAPGDRVLVVGAGTGLDLPLIAAAIGEQGTIIAVDDSAVMLRRSRRRGRDLLGRPRAGWPRIRPVLADLTRARTVLPPGEIPVDAVLAVNTLSLIPDWRRAWRTALAAARPGARVAVADIGRPVPGRPAIAAWSRWISAVGLGDLDARPWRAVEEDLERDRRWTFWAGHVQVRAGDVPWDAVRRDAPTG
ncbi:class I SAM-dependent methyltransferase [uncultured Amnibacterium sp.]|uniref:class I SAM-dependent methyltransferase n=1 Tax=uncultured Amnibacterium sp. TaxID=1631851 RepID=UPI0035C9D49E